MHESGLSTEVAQQMLTCVPCVMPLTGKSILAKAFGEEFGFGDSYCGHGGYVGHVGCRRAVDERKLLRYFSGGAALRLTCRVRRKGKLAQRQNTHTHKHMRMQTHTRTHAHARAHPQSCTVAVAVHVTLNSKRYDQTVSSYIVTSD